MPTSNQQQQQQTDTNNNSNNKIVNGRSGVEVPDIVVAGTTVILTNPTIPSPPTTTTNPPEANHIINNSNNNNNNNNIRNNIQSTQQPRSRINNNINNNDNISSSNNRINSNNNNNNIINNHHYNNNHQQRQQQQQPTSLITSMKYPSDLKTTNEPVVYMLQQQAINNSISMNNNNNNNNVSVTRNCNHTNISSNNNRQAETTATKERSLDELVALIRDLEFDRTLLTNEELIRLVKNNHISIYKLESFLGKDNAARCVEVRRDFYRLELAELDRIDQLGIHDRADSLNKTQYEDLDYERVNGACCENVIGHVKVPVGLAGPLVLDGEEIFVPLATTEGCLVASTCRGLSALRKGGGVSSRVRRDFMTRAPIIRFQDPKLRDALDNVERAIKWLNDKKNKETMRSAFNLTSSHGKFLNYTMHPVNREIHIRFEAQTGDAMGMNMCSKGVESALKEMQRAFPTMEIVTLSGNMCTDKKAAGINWINGRGKSVECNAELPAHVVQQVFKVSVDQLVDRWKSKVMIGSALAASIGGFNSQAANILTAIFIATGQDPAQNVTSSNCMLILEKDPKGNLVVCCTMPSIECGTVGGGTILGDQSRYLQMMGVKGATPRLHHMYRQRQQQQQQIEDSNKCNNRYKSSATSNPSSTLNNSNSSSHLYSNSKDIPNADEQQQQQANIPYVMASGSSAPINYANEYTNARKLARIICATVMAAELSLLAALTEGTLVKSHMRHNRSSTNVTSLTGSTIGGGGGISYSPPCSFEQSSYNHLNNSTSHNNNVNTLEYNHNNYNVTSNNKDDNNHEQVLYNTNNDQRFPSAEGEADGIC